MSPVGVARGVYELPFRVGEVSGPFENTEKLLLPLWYLLCFSPLHILAGKGKLCLTTQTWLPLSCFASMQIVKSCT